MRQLFPECGGDPEPGSLYRPRDYETGFWRSNMVTTMNGAVEFQGVSAPISSGADRKVFRMIRAYADAVVIGRGNALAEGYMSLPAPGEEEAALGGRTSPPRLVVVTRSLGGLGTAPITRSEEQVTIVTTGERRGEGEELAGAFKVAPQIVYVGDNGFTFSQVRAALFDMGLKSVVCEGGPTVLGLMLAAGVLDEVCLTVTPMAAPSNHGGALGPGGDFGLVRLELASLFEEEGTLLYRYEVVKQGPESSLEERGHEVREPSETQAHTFTR